MTEEEKEMFIDLHPFTNASPYTVVETMSLAKALTFFREVGLRHLLVIPKLSNVSAHSHEITDTSSIPLVFDFFMDSRALSEYIWSLVRDNDKPGKVVLLLHNPAGTRNHAKNLRASSKGMLKKGEFWFLNL